MPLSIGIGFSKNENPYRAAQDAAIQAKIQLNDQPADLILVYATPEYSRLEALAVIKQFFPEGKIIGSSTSGLILPTTIEPSGISVLALNTAKQISFGYAAIQNLSNQNPDFAAREFAKKILNDFGPNPRHLSLVFFDGLSEKGPLLLRGLKETFGQFSPIMGGGSFDNFQFKKTYQYFNNEIMTDAACGLMIGGQVSVGLSSQHGWKPLGKPRISNKVEKNIIRQINGKKAISIYEEFLGEEAVSLLSSRLSRARLFYPLGILVEGQNEYLVQHIIDVLSDGSLVFQGEIPQGAEVHVMIGSKDSCKEAASRAAEEAKQALLGRTPELALIFESAARQKLLGRSVFQEIQAVKEILGEDVPVFGMYTYGEFAPLKTAEHGNASFLQNETMNILLFGGQHKT